MMLPPIASQASGCHKLMIFIDGRHRIAQRQCGQLFEAVIKECICAYHERAGTRLAERRESLIKFCVGADVQNVEFDSEFEGRRQ